MQATQSTGAWQRMWAMYHDALEQPAAMRATFVHAAAAGDAALRAEVLSLLEARDRAGDAFLDRPHSAPEVVTEQAVAPVTGQRIGRYLVGRMLAEGGSAVVYEAEQFDPPKAVALKII